jgi:primosomal protein N' (replication factor Y)
MNIITVYPIIRGAFKDELTYWSSYSFKLGSIIEVPLRGRSIPALVGTVLSASHGKANIKQASFVTRKIEKSKELHIVRSECVKACIAISREYAVPLGGVLKACIPDIILQETIEGKGGAKKESGKDSVKENSKDNASSKLDDAEPVNPKITSDVLAFQTNTEDRISTYKSIVREEFARKRSVIIIAPTVMSATELHVSLQKGIEDYVMVLHGNLSKKKQSELWNKALSMDHPLLIICTPLFASIPRSDIQTIILERESSRAYSAIRAPHIDFRDYIEQYAKFLGSRLIYGDTLLRVETLYRREIGELSEFFPISYRVEKTAELIIVDMSNKEIDAPIKNGRSEGKLDGKPDAKRGERMEKMERADRVEKKPFQLFSEELHSMIEYTGKKSLPMFIFTARRGLSPQTVCGDCGHTVECQVCKAPIVLHQKNNAQSHTQSNSHSSSQNNAQSNGNPLGSNPNRFFLCHHCGTERSAIETCTACGSWKLITLGIGIETVADEIKRQFPKREVFRLDKDVVKTDKQAQTVILDFKNSSDGILLGTESSLAFLPEIEYSAIASLDSLFSIPDFKINERITHTILRILEKTSKYVLIQTRNPKNSVLKHIASLNLLGLYREEISIRKMLSYPPFITHIKITIEDSRAGVALKMKKLKQLLEDFEANAHIKFEMLVFPAFVPGAKGKSTLHMLLSVGKNIWPDEHLRALLISLPREYAVRVNPESLL